MDYYSDLHLGWLKLKPKDFGCLKVRHLLMHLDLLKVMLMAIANCLSLYLYKFCK